MTRREETTRKIFLLSCWFASLSCSSLSHLPEEEGEREDGDREEGEREDGDRREEGEREGEEASSSSLSVSPSSSWVPEIEVGICSLSLFSSSFPSLSALVLSVGREREREDNV